MTDRVVEVLSDMAPKILYAAHQKWKRKTALELCASLGVSVKPEKRSWIFPRSAFLYQLEPKTFLIKISDSVSRLMEDFLIFHECAHIVLLLEGGVLYKKFFWPDHESVLDLYRIAETWCDNFAIAMTLALFGFEPVSSEGNSFFNHGMSEWQSIIPPDTGDEWMVRRFEMLIGEKEVPGELRELVDFFGIPREQLLRKSVCH